MGLRIFSVVGEALNFGGRRMETIARVAWLPLLLSMIATMAAVFAMASVIAGQVITFSDIPSFSVAQQQVDKFAARGFQNNPTAMWTISLASVAVQTVLTASFMAPLIRYAGLGENRREVSSAPRSAPINCGSSSPAPSVSSSSPCLSSARSLLLRITR